MSAEAKANGWDGFNNIGERVEKGSFGHPPKQGGYLYRCDGMPTLRGCPEELIVTRRLARVGKKKSGWLVCYGLNDDGSNDEDVVLTFCASCTKVVERHAE